MTRTVDYYFSGASPWAYIGHAPFMELVERHGLSVNYKPVFLGRVFAETGGLPLNQRHPARQRYRLVDLQRWRDRRGLTLNLHPRFWPFDVNLLDRVITAIAARGGNPDRFMRSAFAAIWGGERNLADPLVVAELLEEAGLDSTTLIESAQSSTIEVVYVLNMENAVAADVFGSPAYVLDGEVFWGQDRLDLLDDALTTGRSAYMPTP